MIHLHNSTTGIYNLAAGEIVLNTIPNADVPIIIIILLQIGSDAHPLCGIGGTYQAVITADGADVQPGTSIILDMSPQAQIQTRSIIIPAGATVEVILASPNPADTAVGVTASIYQIDYSLPDALPGVDGGIMLTNDTTVVAIANKTNLLTTGTVLLWSPVCPRGGEIQLVQGCDYSEASGFPIYFEDPDP